MTKERFLDEALIVFAIDYSWKYMKGKECEMKYIEDI